MVRTPFTLVTIAVLAFCASAQAPPRAPSAAEQLDLFGSNRVLLEELLDNGLELSKPHSMVERIEVCGNAVETLGNAVGDAESPERMAEMSNRLSDLMNAGMVPMLNEAQRTISPDSDDYKALQHARERTSERLQRIQSSLPESAKPTTRKQLSELVDQLLADE